MVPLFFLIYQNHLKSHHYVLFRLKEPIFLPFDHFTIMIKEVNYEKNLWNKKQGIISVCPPPPVRVKSLPCIQHQKFTTEHKHPLNFRFAAKMDLILTVVICRNCKKKDEIASN